MAEKDAGGGAAAEPRSNQSKENVKVHPAPGTVVADVNEVLQREAKAVSHFINDENNSTIKKRIRAFLDDATSSREARYFAGELVSDHGKTGGSDASRST